MLADHQPIFIQHDNGAFEVDLCDLLQTMKLDASQREKTAEDLHVPPVLDDHNELMPEDLNYHSDTTSECSSSISSTIHDETYGCAYLQAIRSQLENYPTTGGEYLEAIFTHREIFSSFPAAHQECARGFIDLAYLLEQRAWRADRESDTEAVTAFRHEAWMIAVTLPAPVKQQTEPLSQGGSSFTCLMPPMY